MPIDTSSDAWKAAETPESVTAATLRLLAAYPEKAFTCYEITDHVMGTEFHKMYENAGLRDRHQNGEIDTDEFLEQTHDVPEDKYMDSRLYLEVRLRKLVEEGLIEARSVDASETAVPTDGTVAHYTYALENGSLEDK